MEEYDPDQGERKIASPYINDKMAKYFFSMFWGMEDVYAKRGKKGGYFPQCDNRWNEGLCPKRRGEKVYCDECENAMTDNFLKIFKQFFISQLSIY